MRVCFEIEDNNRIITKIEQEIPDNFSDSFDEFVFIEQNYCRLLEMAGYDYINNGEDDTENYINGLPN